MNIRDTSHPARLSPFGLKDELFKLVGRITNRLMLDAGRAARTR